MKRVLVGIDGSDCSDRALDKACELAKETGALVIVCYVIPWSPYSFSTPEENAERHRRREQELETARTRLLQPRVDAVTEQGVQVESVVRHGHPVRTLIRLAEERNADLLVAGRSGHGSLKARIFGGTAISLIQASPVPVLVVP